MFVTLDHSTVFLVSRQLLFVSLCLSVEKSNLMYFGPQHIQLTHHTVLVYQLAANGSSIPGLFCHVSETLVSKASGTNCNPVLFTPFFIASVSIVPTRRAYSKFFLQPSAESDEKIVLPGFPFKSLSMFCSRRQLRWDNQISLQQTAWFSKKALNTAPFRDSDSFSQHLW